MLAKKFPHIIIPPLPSKEKIKQVPKQIKKRERYYSRFLQWVVRSEELKSCDFLLEFVSNCDYKKWKTY